jgi:molybdopterin molybdotransferase
MAITYGEALDKLQKVAKQYSDEHEGCVESLPLMEALRRVAAKDHNSPASTPPFDTSAMDGYAISSRATINASAHAPITFVVMGSIAAGDDPITVPNEPVNGVFPCVEIMTGARFPKSSSETPFDACVKIEDTISLGASILHSGSKIYQKIAVRRSLPFNTNRRFAGGDLQTGDVILPNGSLVESRHVMALASVGITKITARRALRVAVWSTGNELSEANKGCGDSQIFNSNGPYLIAALEELGVYAEYKGILKDERYSLKAALSSNGIEKWDLVITTGAVSKGKFDFMLPALEELRSDVHFHGVAIRPGHPVLFATTKVNACNTPFFGLPGNPIATAACFRFLVVPFLRYVLGQPCESYQAAQLFVPASTPGHNFPSPPHLDCFRHGVVSSDDRGHKTVVLSTNQSPAVISHFAASNCWVHVPSGRTTDVHNSAVACYPHRASLS